MDFWMLRMPTGYRLSNPKHRKAAKIHAFGLARIILVTLTYIILLNTCITVNRILKNSQSIYNYVAFW